jgi:hypothetical protein
LAYGPTRTAFVPANYTADDSLAEASSTAEIPAHLKGIDNQIAKLVHGEWVTLEVLASAFSFDATRSNYTLPKTAETHTNAVDGTIVLSSGGEILSRVTTTAAADEYSLAGTTLSIHGDITANGKTYQVRYLAVTAGGGTGGTTGWQLIAPRQTLGVATTTVSFASISQDYEHLELRISGRTDRAGATSDAIGIAINADTTDANYRRNSFAWGDSDVDFDADARLIGIATAATAPATAFAAVTVRIPFYAETDRWTTMESRSLLPLGAALGQLHEVLNRRENDAAVTDIDLTSLNGADFVSGCIFELWGLR